MVTNKGTVQTDISNSHLHYFPDLVVSWLETGMIYVIVNKFVVYAVTSFQLGLIFKGL